MCCASGGRKSIGVLRFHTCANNAVRTIYVQVDGGERRRLSPVPRRPDQDTHVRRRQQDDREAAGAQAASGAVVPFEEDRQVRGRLRRTVLRRHPGASLFVRLSDLQGAGAEPRDHRMRPHVLQ